MAQSETEDKLLELMAGIQNSINSNQLAVERRLGSMESSQAVLINRMETVEAQVTGLTNTIRGSNGTPGLATQYAVIQTKLDAVLEIKDSSKPDNSQPIKSKEEKESKEDKDKVTWSFLIERVVVPIGVTALLWFLLTVLPRLLAQVGEL